MLVTFICLVKILCFIAWLPHPVLPGCLATWCAGLSLSLVMRALHHGGEITALWWTGSSERSTFHIIISPIMYSTIKRLITRKYKTTYFGSDFEVLLFKYSQPYLAFNTSRTLPTAKQFSSTIKSKVSCIVKQKQCQLCIKGVNTRS